MSSAFYNKAGERPEQYDETQEMPNRNFHRRQARPPVHRSRFPPSSPSERNGRGPTDRYSPPANSRRQRDEYRHRDRPLARPPHRFEERQLEHQRRQQQIRRQQHLQRQQGPGYLPRYHSPPVTQQQRLPPALGGPNDLFTPPDPYSNIYFRGKLVPEAGASSSVLPYGFDFYSQTEFEDSLAQMEAYWGYERGTWYEENMRWVNNNYRYLRPSTDVATGTGFLAEIDGSMPVRFPDMQSPDGHRESAAEIDLIEEGEGEAEQAAPASGEAQHQQQQSRERQASVESLDFGDVLAAGANDWEAELGAL